MDRRDMPGWSEEIVEMNLMNPAAFNETDEARRTR
jgi:hypothetical protein